MKERSFFVYLRPTLQCSFGPARTLQLHERTRLFCVSRDGWTKLRLVVVARWRSARCHQPRCLQLLSSEGLTRLEVRNAKDMHSEFNVGWK